MLRHIFIRLFVKNNIPNQKNETKFSNNLKKNCSIIKNQPFFTQFGHFFNTKPLNTTPPKPHSAQKPPINYKTPTTTEKLHETPERTKHVAAHRDSCQNWISQPKLERLFAFWTHTGDRFRFFVSFVWLDVAKRQGQRCKIAMANAFVLCNLYRALVWKNSLENIVCLVKKLYFWFCIENCCFCLDFVRVLICWYEFYHLIEYFWFNSWLYQIYTF